MCMSSWTESRDETCLEDEVWVWACAPAPALRLKSFPSMSARDKGFLSWGEAGRRGGGPIARHNAAESSSDGAGEAEMRRMVSEHGHRPGSGQGRAVSGQGESRRAGDLMDAGVWTGGGQRTQWLQDPEKPAAGRDVEISAETQRRVSIARGRPHLDSESSVWCGAA